MENTPNRFPVSPIVADPVLGQELYILEGIDSEDIPLEHFDSLPLSPQGHPDIVSRQNYIKDLLRLRKMIHSLEELENTLDVSDDTVMQLRDAVRHVNPDFMNEEPSTALKAIEAGVAQYFVDFAKSFLSQDSKVVESIVDVFQNGSWKSLSAHQAAYTLILRLYKRMNEARGLIVQDYVQEAAQEGRMNPIAELEYERFSSIASYIDDFFIKWRLESKYAQRASERGDKKLTNELCVLRSDPETGEMKEVLWHEAFPEEIREISNGYLNLAQEIGQLDGASDPAFRETIRMKKAYYAALATAYATSDVDAFRIADALLARQRGGRTDVPFHAHTIEIGYEGDLHQRIPEANLGWPDAEAGKLNRECAKMKAIMYSSVSRFFKSKAGQDYSFDSAVTAELILKCNCEARQYIGAGWRMAFRGVGVILPNELGSRQKGGVDISMDRENMKKRRVHQKECYRAVFGEDLADRDPDDLAVHCIATHEFAHAVGVIDDTPERLGETYTYMEEWKATAAGMVFAEYELFLAGEGVTMEDLKQQVFDQLAIIPRYLSMRGEISVLPYVRGSLMFARVAQTLGILKKTSGAGEDAPGGRSNEVAELRLGVEEERWEIDVSDDEAVCDFYRVLKEQVCHLLKIYDVGGTPKKMCDFVKTNLKPCEFAEFAAKKVDAHYGLKDGSMPTIEEICRVD